jgi:hypothetical protein
VNQYAKRQWSESRGDEYDDWGKSWWYFELTIDGSVLRQIEQYDSGAVLKYSEHHVSDQYGFLGDQQLDTEESEFQKLSSVEFENLWRGLKALNCEPQRT